MSAEEVRSSEIGERRGAFPGNFLHLCHRDHHLPWAGHLFDTWKKELTGVRLLLLLHLPGNDCNPYFAYSPFYLFK